MRTIDFLQMSHSQAAMKASDIAYENEQLRQQLAEKDAEIARLRSIESIAREYGIIGFVDIEQIHNQLAASQARELQYREVLEWVVDIFTDNTLSHERDPELWVGDAKEALALPTDTPALEALIAKAGEVMREWALDPHLTRRVLGSEVVIAEAIRALPGVTMEDLQK